MKTHYRLRWARLAIVLLLVLTNLLPGPVKPAPVSATGNQSPTSVEVCPPNARTIIYDVAAFQTMIPLNGWGPGLVGDHIPDGLMYALYNDDAYPNKDDILDNPKLTEPLVLRANVGDCIQVNFRNDIPGLLIGMHVDGVSKDPRDSDGARIGDNPDTTVFYQQTRTYKWYADHEGQFVINDYGSGTAFKMPEVITNTTSKGLYGALIVEPPGSTWHDIKTGANLITPTGNPNEFKGIGTRIQADIRGPGNNDDFREFVAVFMDEPQGVKDGNGQDPTFPETGLPDPTFGINYRSEPLRNRLRAIIQHRTSDVPVTLPNGTVIQPADHFCDGWVPELGRVVDDPGAKCLSEEVHLQSWPFGDPGKLVTVQWPGPQIRVDSDNLIAKAYIGDPVRFRLIHPGIKETHTWHQHTNRWRHEPDDVSPTDPISGSTRLDVQSTGPGQTFELRFEGGAGEAVSGTAPTPGDQIFHCHLYPHFAEGFWGIFRVFDRLRTGPAWAALNQKYPDQTPVEELKELPDRHREPPDPPIIPPPDATHPGFPLFVKGDYLQKAYRPPLAVITDPFQTQRRPGDTIRSPTVTETLNMVTDPVPGTFFIDPCRVNNIPPPASQIRTYYPAIIDAKIVYNDAGWYDPNGKLYVDAKPTATKTALQVADEIRQQINLSQTIPLDDGRVLPVEPYTIRARVGDCVNLQTTNATHLDNDPNVPMDIHADPDGDGFHLRTEMSEAGTHVHLVHFDELASDGTSIGWNYDSTPLAGQTYAYRWYVDVNLRTVFFHDHQYANVHQQHGLWAAMNVEPSDADWRDPVTGNSTNGIGAVADISTTQELDFREFTVHYSDFVPQRDAAGNLINPPNPQGDYNEDQGVMATNYRNEPFPIRLNEPSPGSGFEPAHIFSSAVHGDPSTPTFRAYPGDRVIFRFMDGAHEEQHNFNLAGHRWLHEPSDPDSNYYDTQSSNIAEFFNFEITAEGPGDYLYSSQPLNDLWLGVWGIFRVLAARPDAGQAPDLQPLPDHPAPPWGNPWPALRPGDPIATPPPGLPSPCPDGAPAKTFDVSLLKVSGRVPYNPVFQEYDDTGLAYVLGATPVPPVKPLFIRANEGDCVTVTFTNRLPKLGIPVHYGPYEDPINPVEGPNTWVNVLVGGKPTPVQAVWPASERGSMHPAGLVRYNVLTSDGSAVGYNWDTTVPRNGSITYRYYVERDQTPGREEVGIVNIANWANIRGTRHHGAWAGLVVEPEGAIYLDPNTLDPLQSGENAVIRYPDGGGMRSFREFVMAFQDGLNLCKFDPEADRCVPIQDEVLPLLGQNGVDPEDQGEKGINYRTERFKNRLANNPEIAWVFSSVIHGDPETPVFTGYLADPVKVRLLSPQDLPRAHTGGTFGHEWLHEPSDPNSNVINGQGGFHPTRAFNLVLINGAGGRQQVDADYLYNDRNFFFSLSGGLWGLLRVKPVPPDCSSNPPPVPRCLPGP